MEFLVNDLSIHGQFHDLGSFQAAVERVMTIRQIAHRYGWALHCHRGILQATVTPTMMMVQAAQSLPLEQRRALLLWLTQQGPFWEEARQHGENEWLAYNGDPVTDTAVGEAAWCCLNSIERRLVSLTPSKWEFSPVPVEWVSDDGSRTTVEVANHWLAEEIELTLQTALGPPVSWETLEHLSMAQCTQLTFAEEAFAPLNGYPFAPSAAKRVLAILIILNRFKTCFDSDGNRTAEGHEIYTDFFTGKKGNGGRGALFSDSSDDEKIRFKTAMTFDQPGHPGQTLFCPWHGKVQTPQLRVHFSWPISANEPLYIVYVGPKITRR